MRENGLRIWTWETGKDLNHQNTDQDQNYPVPGERALAISRSIYPYQSQYIMMNTLERGLLCMKVKIRNREMSNHGVALKENSVCKSDVPLFAQVWVK